ncbi:biopolymer transport protein ExbD/TolR [Aquipluma nitroreducens]|uniref:Biopolymer transport protein ExbD/TolR n=1 Tax=Aquipluma nitroreducens TaxID=2010828 RepID=A0A5K7SDN2_9BACT|nr:biopolymer transporter ExbD [Aquipluma nitroreducens]MDD2305514.1 biopolymer transporter ExbD [Prolixibacteraceae bacterium]BBE19576.1 biopolymer transport protein ExbD/TolR [Aquipluma nitroreducens]
MNFRGTRKQEFEVFTGSFSDIMFFLMLFFLIVSTMITPGAIKLALPQADKSPSMDKQTEKIAISITKDLKYFINDRELQFAQIEPELLKIKKGNDNAFAIVRCDNTIAVQSMVDVLQLGNKVGVKMVLATTRKDASK